MQTLIQIAFMFAFMLFSMLSGFMLDASPVAALASFAVAAICAAIAVVSALQENAAR